jgi:hypothetical protein
MFGHDIDLLLRFLSRFRCVNVVIKRVLATDVNASPRYADVWRVIAAQRLRNSPMPRLPSTPVFQSPYSYLQLLETRVTGQAAWPDSLILSRNSVCIRLSYHVFRQLPRRRVRRRRERWRVLVRRMHWNCK